MVEVLFRHAADLPIRFLVSSRKDPRIWQSRAGTEITQIDIIRAAPAGTAEVYDYVGLRLAGHISDAVQRDEIARLVQDASAGNFLYAYYASAAMRRSGASPAELTDLPAGLTGWYERFLERELRPPGNAAAERRWATVIRPCLELILACRSEGFDAAEIARKADLSASAVDDFYRVAGQYLQGDVDDVWSVYHKSFAQFLSEGHPPIVDRREGDLRIVRAAYRQCDGAWDRCTDHYLLEHLPSHLAELATRTERHRLYDLLTETGFPARQVWLARSVPRAALLPAQTFRCAVRVAMTQAEYAPAARLLLHWSVTQRLIALHSPVDVALSLGAEEALEATRALPPPDALVWHLLISVFLLDSGRGEEARQVIHDVLDGSRHVIPGARQELVAWCLARLSGLVEIDELERLVERTLRPGYSRQFVVLYLMGRGEHGRAVRMLHSIAGSFEEERPERDLVYDALATRQRKDVRSIARQVLDRHRRSFFGDLFREPDGEAGYDELERHGHGDVSETVRLCQAILGIRAATRVALDQGGEEEDSWNGSAGQRAWLLAVLAATQRDPRYRDELSALVREAYRQRSRRRLTGPVDDDSLGRNHDDRESTRVLYEYGRYLLWSGRTTEARRVFEDVAPDLFGRGLESGWLHHDIFHGHCDQRFEIEAVVHMGAAGFLDPAINLAQRYAAEGLGDGVRALLRIRAWSRRASADDGTRVVQAIASTLDVLPDEPHITVLRALAACDMYTPAPDGMLRTLAAAMSDYSETSEQLRRATAQSLMYTAKVTADRDLAVETLRRSYEVKLAEVPNLSVWLADLLQGIGPVEVRRLMAAMRAPEGRLDREQGEEIVHRWLCSGKIAEAHTLLDGLTLDSSHAPLPQLRDGLRRLRDGQLPNVTQLSLLPTMTVVGLATAVAHTEPPGPAREELRRYAVARVEREVDTLERENQGEAYGMMSAQKYFGAASWVRWYAALFAVLGETVEAQRALRIAEWFVIQGDGGIQMSQAMGWGDIRGDSLARDEEESESVRLLAVLTVAEHLRWGGRLTEAREMLVTAFEPMRGFQHADLVSKIATRAAEVAAGAGWQQESLHAAELIVEDPELRLAGVAAEMTTVSDEEVPTALADLVERVAVDGRHALAAIGPVLLAVGTTAVTVEEIVLECERWLTQLRLASKFVQAREVETGDETDDRASAAELRERWSELAAMRAAALEEAESAAMPDTEAISQRRRELASAYWQAEMWDAETQLWAGSLAQARRSGRASIDQLDDLRDELAESLVCAGRYDEAIELWTEALAESLRYDAGEMWRADEYLWSLRWIYRLQDRWDDLAEMWRDALTQFRPLRDPKTIRFYEEELAWTYDRGGQPKGGADVWVAALEAALASGEPDKADELRKKLADAHRKAKRHQAAAQVWLDALAGTTGSGPQDPARVDRYRRELASAYKYADAHDKVIEFWSATLDDALARGDLDEADSHRENLAKAYSSASYRNGSYKDPNGQDPEATVWLDALADAMSVPQSDRMRIARYRDKVNWIFQYHGHGDEMVALWELALVQALEAPDPRPAEVQSVRMHLAFGYGLANRFEEAIAVWRELLADVRRDPDHDIIEADNVRRRLAETCRRAERPDQEADTWLEAIAQAQSETNRDEDRISRYYKELAAAYEHTERWDDLVELWSARHDELSSLDNPDPRSADDAREQLRAALARGGRWGDLVELEEQRVTEASIHPDGTGLDAARVALADAYREAGRADDAARIWRDALAGAQQGTDPASERTRHYRQRLNQTLSEAGAWEELLELAEADFIDTCVTGDAEAVHKARIALADLLHRTNRPADQARVLAEGLAEARSPGGANDSWASAFRDGLARLHEQQGQWDELVRLWEAELDAASSGDSDSLAACRRDLASAYRQAGRHADEGRIWREAVADAGSDEATAAQYRATLVEAYQHGGLWDDLIALWEGILAEERRAEPLDPGVLDDLHGRIARTYSDAGRHTQAAALWRAALAEERSGDVPDAERLDRLAVGLADSYGRASRWDDQLKFLRAHEQDMRLRLGETAPIALRAMERLATAAFENRGYAEADALLEKLIERASRRKAAGALHLQRGRVLLFSDNVADAEAEFGLAAESGNWQFSQTAWGYRGFARLQLGQLDEAALAYAQARCAESPGGPALVSMMQADFIDALQRAKYGGSPADAWVQFLIAVSSAGDGQTPSDPRDDAALGPWDLESLVAWALNDGSMPFALDSTDAIIAAVQPNPRLAPHAYRPPFSRAEVIALTLCAAGKPTDAADIMARVLPQRLAGERFLRPVYELLGSHPGINLDPMLSIWGDVCATDPDAAGPWGFESHQTGP